MQKPNVVYELKGVSDVMETDLKWRVNDNVEGKMTSSLKKIYSKWEDVEVVIKVTVKKVSEWYDGDFKLEYDGDWIDYGRKWFEILKDLVNHAFDNFKQRILAK